MTDSATTKERCRWKALMAEIDSYAWQMNHHLAYASLCQHLLPLRMGSTDLIDRVRDGLLLASFVSKIEDSGIETAQLHVVSYQRDGTFDPLNGFQCAANQVKVLQACKRLGIKTVNIGPDDLVDGAEHIMLILGLIKQLLRIYSLQKMGSVVNNQISENNQGFVSDSTANHILLSYLSSKLSPEDRERCLITSLTDLKSGDGLLRVLESIDPFHCPFPTSIDTAEEKCKRVIAYARTVGADTFVRASDIQQGNKTLLFDLVVSIMKADQDRRSISKKPVLSQTQHPFLQLSRFFSCCSIRPNKNLHGRCTTP